MKKNVALAIALMVLGTLGLIRPPQSHTSDKPPVAPRQTTTPPLEPDAVLLRYKVVDAPALKAACTRPLTASGSPNVLQKMTVALSDLDTVVSLQGIGSGT